MPYQFLADAVLTLHPGLVAFVVGGLPAIVAGNRFGRQWVNRRWLRLAHLAAIAVVAAYSAWALAVPGAWWRWPPRPRPGGRPTAGRAGEGAP